MTKIKTPEPLSPDNNQLHPLVPRDLSTTSSNTSTMVIHRNKNHHHQRHHKPLTASEQRQRQMDREEMQSLLAKLKQLVPGIPKHRRLSKLEIIQHVIDYIFDLQMALESHPIASSVAASAIAADFVTSSFVSSQPSTTTSSLDSSTITISCDRYFNNNNSNNNNNTNGIQQQTSSPLPQRIPGSNRQPLASIVL